MVFLELVHISDRCRRGSGKVSTCGAFDMNAVIDGILGIIGPLSGVIIGAILSYFIFKRQKTSERLTEGIYRPLLGQVGQIFEKMQHREMPDLKIFDQIRLDGMYYVMDEKVKEKASQVYQRLKDYQNAYATSVGRIDKIIDEEVEKVVVQLKDPEKYRRGRGVAFSAFTEGQFMGRINLEYCLRMGKDPLQVLKEEKPRLKDSDIECLIAGYTVDRRLADPMVESALKKVNEDLDIQEESSLRNSLLIDLQGLIEMLKKQVV